MEIVWKSNGSGINERCVVNDNGDFVGVKTGTVYSKETHYCSDKIKAKVVRVDDKQLNGMIHLEPGSEQHIRKQNFIGCTLTFRKAHFFGDIQVYHCFETEEYFNQNELEVLIIVPDKH